MDFWRTVEILSKRKWFILLSVIVAMALTLGATKLVGSKWTATVQFVAPQSAITPLTNGQDSSNGDSNSELGVAVAKSQAIIYNAIVKSRDVLEPSLKSLGQTQLPPDLLKNIEFSATAPRLFQLQVTDSSPSRARDLANALADNFVTVFHNVRTDQAKKTVQVLEDQLKDADTKLAKARSNYDSYRDLHHIVGSLNANLDTALMRLRDARQKQEDAVQKMAAAQARLGKLNAEIALAPATVEVAAPVTASAGVRALQDDLAKAEQQLTELKARYTESMPIVQKAQKARDDLAARLSAEQGTPGQPNMVQQPNPAIAPMRQEIHGLKQEIAGCQALITALNVSYARAQSDINAFKGVDSPLGVLATEVAAQSETRNSLAARVRNAHMMLDATESQTPITIMDRVNDFNPAINATAGRSSKLLMIAAICALLLTSGIIIGLDTVDRRVRTVKEAEIALPAPVLAAIPQPMGAVTYASLARATELHPQSLHSEAYRFLSLHLLNRHFPAVRSLMVVSAKAEQGATTTLTNLGITLAQAGKRVILVDANIRTAELHQVFELPNQYGYMDLLQTPREGADEAIAQATHATTVPNLSVITSGRQPVNPWEVFRSENVREISRKLRDRADYVLYDTPSSVVFTDALNLAPVVDASFLCVRALEPITGAEHRLTRLLEEAHVPVLGCVLNDVPASVVEGYHNYQHYYQPSANMEVVAESGTTATATSSPRLPSWIDLPGDGDRPNTDNTDNDV
jgi:capsular exopolysaccharide synthesis family protein